ncbi:MAG: SusD/RagB family nutrient-binding outer membrane lipoprotein [Lutibacter sp.]
MNVDTKSATEVPGETLFSNAQKNLVDFLASTNVNINIYKMFAQYWTETTYVDEANFDVQNRSIPRNQWNRLYRDVLRDLNEATTVISSEGDGGLPAVKQNKLAITEILKVYTFKMLVDTFGDVPYTQALDADNVNPAYDDAATIYSDLLSRLNTAMGQLDSNSGSFGGADLVYGGDVAHWKMFANALKMEFGIMMNDASTTAQGAAGTFASTADNAMLQYLDAPPNTNPLWVDLVQSGRSDFVLANTLVDKMNALNDPRRYKYMAENLGADTFVGGTYGASNSFPSFTHIADAVEAPTFPQTIFSYSQTEFMKAEAVKRGLLSGNAQTFYDNAVMASMDEWGVASGDASTYLTNNPYDDANWQESIGTQAWISLYTRGYAAWTTWRRLDFPVLTPPAISQLPVPVRMTYPVSEQTLNGSNYTAAASAIGGDTLDNHLFWDN